MTKKDFLAAIQSRTARVAIGASTARGRGSKGAVRAARRFLARLRLAGFGVRNRPRFETRLNRATTRLVAALPRRARRWGLARKFLNIFLRDCLYTKYLADANGLDRVEELLELPLDSITAKELRKAAGRGQLPRWPGVRKLTKGTSARYQAVALEEAQKEKIARVHLDAKYWAASRDAAEREARNRV
jgi:hypothetical protein